MLLVVLGMCFVLFFCFFFFNDTATTEIYTLSLHDALPTCHTLTTEHQGVEFAEQTPYLEWRNSEFSDEAGASETSRTCQQCHMAATGATRIARNPMGRDFLIPVRDGYAAHAFVGGNAFMLDLLRVHRDA